MQLSLFIYLCIYFQAYSLNRSFSIGVWKASGRWVGLGWWTGRALRNLFRPMPMVVIHDSNPDDDDVNATCLRILSLVSGYLGLGIQPPPVCLVVAYHTSGLKFITVSGRSPDLS